MHISILNKKDQYYKRKIAEEKVKLFNKTTLNADSHLHFELLIGLLEAQFAHKERQTLAEFTYVMANFTNDADADGDDGGHEDSDEDVQESVAL